MAKIATSKQTGGGGFNFEDKVTSYFLSKMLTGNLALDPLLGNLEKIAFQVRPDGWLLDDLLLFLNDGKATHKVAVSAKSNRQITGGGLPADIVKDIWNQFLNIDHDLFDPALDYLLFIVSPIARSVAENLTKLIQSAQAVDPATLAKRIRTAAFSKPQQDLFDSFTCPEPWISSIKLTDEDTCRLLSRLIVLEFDFQNTVSKDELAMIAELQGALRSKSQLDAQRLYKRLNGIRPDLAPHGGAVDRAGLIGMIVKDFELADQPQFEPDWVKIDQLTGVKLANLPDKIGGRFSIDRSLQKKKVTDMLAENQFLFLIGNSGFGKTVVAKQIANDTLAAKSKVIWIDAETLQTDTLEQAIRLSHTFEQLASNVNSLNNLVIVDGADRLFKENLIAHLTPLIRTLSTLNATSWRMVLTCQTEDYEALLKALYRHNLPALDGQIFALEAVGKNDLIKTCIEIPQLTGLLKHDHLVKLMQNLKYLDLLAFHVGSSSFDNLGRDFSESALIDWIWRQEISDNGDNGSVNSRFLQELAGKQADQLTIYTPVTDFSIPESAPVSELKRLKLIAETNDRLYFVHDLIGDWARYKTIRSKGDQAKDFLLTLDLASPLWSKAIRLFGIHLLEKEQDTKGWQVFFSSLSTSDPKHKLIRTLLLEAIIFSNDTFKYLEDLWKEFKKSDGALLNQFFEQFLIRGTAPDTEILRLVSVLPGLSVSQVAAEYRIPIFNYWFEVLAFINVHAADIMEIARGNCRKIVAMWLKNVPKGSTHRTDMAKIAVEMAQWLFDQKENEVIIMGKVGEEIYGTMLHAYSEFPDAVEDLSLKLARLKEFRPPAEQKKREKDRLLPFFSQKANHVPTSFTPFERVDDGFRNACLNEYALNPMMRLNAELVTKLTLALLLKEKNANADSSTSRSFGLKDIHGWFPPFYTRGPFATFLMADELAGIRLVIELANIAALNWKLERNEPDTSSIINITFPDGEVKTYIADHELYFWFRDLGSAPHSLVSALMALEKFLFGKIAANEDITTFLQTILAESNSVATIGLIISLGKHSPELFAGVLLPLLSEINFLHWEMSVTISSRVEGHQLIGSDLLGAEGAKQAYEWHNMPHRKRSLQSVARLLLINNVVVQRFYKEIVLPSWIKLRDGFEKDGFNDPYLNNMIGQFNRDNYVEADYEGQLALIYQEPESVTERLKDVRESNSPNADDDLFVFKTSQDIEKNKSYTLSDLEHTWNKVRHFNALPDEPNFLNLNSPAANVFAGIAVLLTNWEHIESDHPEWIEWCISHVDQYISIANYDYGNESILPLSQSPESFCAKIIPLIYARAPQDERVRRIVGGFTLIADHETISLFFGSMAGQLKWYDKEFIQVQNLYIERCHLIYHLEVSRWNASEVDFEGLLNPALHQFISGEISSDPVDFVKYRPAEPTQTSQRQSRRHGKYYASQLDPGLNLYSLYHAYGQLPLLGTTGDNKTEEYISNLYKSLIDLLIYTWGDISDESLPHDEYPTQFDHWFTNRLAKVFTAVPDVEKAKSLWEPLLAYGNLNHKWLEDLFTQLLYANLGTSETAMLGEHWNAMINYAFKTKTWGSDRRFHNGASLWDNLLGLSNVGIEIWRGGYVAMIIPVKEQLIKWFGKQVANADEIQKLCLLLMTPCCDLFLNPGIRFVNAHLKYQVALDDVEVPKGLVRVAFKYYNEVGKMCSHIWENKKTELMASAEVFAAYKEILIHLVSVQNPTGIELQDRLLSM
jgi:hypothetical protein